MTGRFLTGRMTTGIERTFKRLPDGLYREIYIHLIHFKDAEGNVVSTKIQKQIEGKLFKEITNEQNDRYRIAHGELADFETPEGDKIKLVAYGMDYSDSRYGKGL